MKVGGVPGSLRRHSYNRRLLKAAALAAPRGMTVTVVACDLLASIPPFNQDLEERSGGDPEPVRRLRDAIREADALLISTPEYNQAIPGDSAASVCWRTIPN